MLQIYTICTNGKRNEVLFDILEDGTVRVDLDLLSSTNKKLLEDSLSPERVSDALKVIGENPFNLRQQDDLIAGQEQE